MPKYWFDHVHLISSDPIKTAEFYEKTLGAKREDVKTLPDGRALVSIDTGGAILRVSNPRPQPLVPDLLPAGLGLEHFGLETDNIEAAVAELKAKGIKFLQEITALPIGVKIAFFLTPENILIELLQPES
jgi:catechol 2,3-dioxygenase-like lactoylglutathione lyase family enzyme